MTSVAMSTAVAESAKAAAARRVALRDAFIAWLAHEALVVSVMALSVQMGVAGAALVHAHLIKPPVTWSELLNIWMGWGDAGAYSQLATHGYATQTLAPYYPLLPLLERALSPLTGGDARAAGLLIANAAALPAFYLLRALAERETGERRLARLALALIAITPFSFFLAMGYTESLFLLLSLAAFAAARDRRWLAAGIFASLAVLTRATGLLLVLPILIEAGEALRWRFRGWRALARPLVALALPVIGLLVFWLYEAVVYGTPLAAARAERAYYARWLDWPWYGPLVGLGIVARHADPWRTVHALIELVVLAGALVCAVALARRRPVPLPLSYIAYGGAVLVFTLVLPIHGSSDNGQYSLPRYLLADFPLYLALAGFCARSRWVRAGVVAGCLIICLLLTLLQAAAFAIA